MDEKRAQPIPSLVKLETVPQHINYGREFLSDEFKTKDGSIVNIRSVKTPEEVWTAEEIWRQAAERGIGFGIDEFTEQGHFNRSFLRDSNVIIAEDSHGEIIASAIFGSSSLSRAEKSLVAQLYLAVSPKSGDKGVGSKLMEHCMKLIKTEGYMGCLTDTYANNTRMLQMLRECKFEFRGSLPKAGFFKNEGAVDSFIIFRELK